MKKKKRKRKTFPVCLLARRILETSMPRFPCCHGECHRGCLLTRNTGTWASGMCVVVAQGWSPARTVGSVPSSVTTKGIVSVPLSTSYKNEIPGDFPSGPVAKTLCSQGRGPGLIPGELRWGTRIPHAAQHSLKIK